MTKKAGIFDSHAVLFRVDETNSFYVWKLLWHYFDGHTIGRSQNFQITCQFYCKGLLGPKLSKIELFSVICCPTSTTTPSFSLRWLAYFCTPVGHTWRWMFIAFGTGAKHSKTSGKRQANTLKCCMFSKCIYITVYLRPWFPNGRYLISYWNQALTVLWEKLLCKKKSRICVLWFVCVCVCYLYFYFSSTMIAGMMWHISIFVYIDDFSMIYVLKFLCFSSCFFCYCLFVCLFVWLVKVMMNIMVYHVMCLSKWFVCFYVFVFDTQHIHYIFTISRWLHFCVRCFRFWKVHVEINTWIIVKSLWGQSDTNEQQNEMKASNVLIVAPVFLLISHVPVSSCQVMSHLHPINSNSCILGRLFEKCGFVIGQRYCFNHMIEMWSFEPWMMQSCMYSYTL